MDAKTFRVPSSAGDERRGGVEDDIGAGDATIEGAFTQQIRLEEAQV